MSKNLSNNYLSSIWKTVLQFDKFFLIHTWPRPPTKILAWSVFWLNPDLYCSKTFFGTKGCFVFWTGCTPPSSSDRLNACFTSNVLPSSWNLWLSWHWSTDVTDDSFLKVMKPNLWIKLRKICGIGLKWIMILCALKKYTYDP